VTTETTFTKINKSFPAFWSQNVLHVLPRFIDFNSQVLYIYCWKRQPLSRCSGHIQSHFCRWNDFIMTGDIVLRTPQWTHYLLTGSDSLPATTTQYQHVAITPRSRQLLKMGTWLPETCWTTCKGEIKDNTKVTSDRRHVNQDPTWSCINENLIDFLPFHEKPTAKCPEDYFLRTKSVW